MPLSRGGGGAAPPALQADCHEKLDSKCYNSKLNFIENPVSKNFEKMVDFFDQIVAKMLENRGLKGVWAPPWGVWRALGGFWAVLGSKRPLG